MTQTVDPTFYRSPAEAIAAPRERLAYVAAYDRAGKAKDATASRRSLGSRFRPVVRVRPAGLRGRLLNRL